MPNLLLTWTTSRSPTATLMVGHGHWPLIPITGLVMAPSGFAITQVISQLYVTVVAAAIWAKARRIGRNENMVPIL